MYIASLSYGKDSIAMLEVIKRNKLQLDRIVHVEIMATDNIYADLPPMMEFKDKADRVIKGRYGIEVERIRSKISFEEYFYRKRVRGNKKGQIYGFPIIRGNWCNSRLKMRELSKLERRDNVIYVGIAANERGRFKILNENKRSPLIEFGISEEKALEICRSIGLVPPVYKDMTRVGCWFCHNQSIGQLRYLRKEYPVYWELMLKWDKDSPTVFKPGGRTVKYFEDRFAEEEKQLRFEGDKWI